MVPEQQRQRDMREAWRKWKHSDIKAYDTFRKWSDRQLAKIKRQSLRENASINWDTMRVF